MVKENTKEVQKAIEIFLSAFSKDNVEDRVVQKAAKRVEANEHQFPASSMVNGFQAGGVSWCTTLWGKPWQRLRSCQESLHEDLHIDLGTAVAQAVERTSIDLRVSVEVPLGKILNPVNLHLWIYKGVCEFVNAGL